MNAPLRRVAATLPLQCAATVTAVDGREVTVAIGDDVYEATQAVSCLVAPREGDRVLVASADDTLWVLAVLRSETRDVHLRAPDGKVVIAAKEGVHLVTPGEATVTAGTLRAEAREGSVVMESLVALASRIEVEADKVRGKFTTLDTVAERIHQRAERVYRIIKTLDQTRAGQVEVKAQDTVRVHAQDTLLTSDNLVKIDGRSIQIG